MLYLDIRDLICTRSKQVSCIGNDTYSFNTLIRRVVTLSKAMGMSMKFRLDINLFSSRLVCNQYLDYFNMLSMYEENMRSIH
jgi:hypothetical protein